MAFKWPVMGTCGRDIWIAIDLDFFLLGYVCSFVRFRSETESDFH